MFPCDGCLIIAKKLATIQDEASMRSAVSRAYYATFHRVKLFAANHGVKFSSGMRSNIHKEIIDFLNYHTDQKVKLLSPKLDRLRNDRNKCDYADSINNISNITQKSIIYADNIFNDLK